MAKCGANSGRRGEEVSEMVRSGGPWKGYEVYCGNLCGRVKGTLWCEKSTDEAGPWCDKSRASSLRCQKIMGRKEGDYGESQCDQIRGCNMRRQGMIYCRAPIPLEKMKKWSRPQGKRMEGLPLSETG